MTQDDIIRMALEALTPWMDSDHTVQHAAYHALRAALAQQAEPDHETRAELAEQQVVQLAEERDHYRNLWQKAQRAEPVEPVAWSGYDLDGMVEALSRVIEAHYQRTNPFQNPIDMDAQMALRTLRGFIPAMKAYTAPPQCKPLTDEEIQAAWDSVDMRHPRGNETRIAFARAVERAHGIPMPEAPACPDCHGIGYDASGQTCACQENPSF